MRRLEPGALTKKKSNIAIKISYQCKLEDEACRIELQNNGFRKIIDIHENLRVANLDFKTNDTSLKLEI